ncbi:MAG: DUF2752 domain-containing protein [Bacteroidota bacterium]
MIKIGILIGIPILLLCLPADYFDEGESISFFAQLGVEGFYSEGMTRACMHLLHLDFLGAANYNQLSFFVMPILGILWLSALGREISVFRKAYFLSVHRETAETTPEAAARPRGKNLPVVLLVFLPAVGFTLALHYFFLPYTTLNFAIAMPIVVVVSGLGTVVFQRVKQADWTRRFLGTGLYAFALLVVMGIMSAAFPIV